MSDEKFLSPRNDLAFKRIFGTEKNKDILIHFLNDILTRSSPIEKVTFLKTIQDPEIAPLRVSIVDVMCEDSEKNLFVIEMQLSHEKGFDKRALYYASKAYCSQRTDQIPYCDLNDVYFLAITNFIPFPNKKHWLSHIGLTDLQTNEHDIPAIQLFFMQLPLFTKTERDLATMTIKEKWAYFFKYAHTVKEEDMAQIIGQDAIIQRAYDELNRFHWTREELRTYDSIEMKQAADLAVIAAAIDIGQEKGIAIGKEEGIAIGKEEGLAIGKEEGIAIGKEEGLTIGKEEGIAIGKEEGLAIGKEEGLAIGKEEGLAIGKENVKEIARKLIAQGLDRQTIITITGVLPESL
jgi:predicted transposase/invertase (TIGR01784 family)